MDNIIVAQELIYTMNHLKGKRGFMAIKVDLEKAYDRMSWDFIEKTLSLAHFLTLMIRIIMRCITTPTYRVLWNGEPSKKISSSRGIRQGNPISPYNFVLCLERLSQEICRAIFMGE